MQSMADKLLSRVRYRMMTFDEKEAKAKELGIESPHQMMQRGDFIIDYSAKCDYESHFWVKEYIDDNGDVIKE